MKKLFLLLAICGISFSAFSQTEEPPAAPIDLKGGGLGPKPNRPRTMCPVTAYYNMGGVDLLFTADLGIVAVTVVNQTTGEQWFDLADTASGAARIDTSTPEPAGAYLIYLEQEDGTCYWGEFFEE